MVAFHEEIRASAQKMLQSYERDDGQRIAIQDFAGGAARADPPLAISELISRGSTVVYFGQDVGEDGSEEAGFGDPTRTTIFDYAGVPAHQRFMNNGKFDAGQSTDKEKALHRFYKDIMNIAATNSAITGRYQSLHAPNLNVEGSAYSEQQFAFLREKNGQGIIVLANFSEAPTGPISLAVPATAMQASDSKLELKPLLSHDGLTLEQNEVNYRAITSLNALETKVFAF